MTAPQTNLRHALLAIATLLASSLTAHADSLDERFLSGLRERRLFSLAEKFCVERLARTDLTDQARAIYTIELSRTFAEHARQTLPDSRDRLWQQALDAPSQLLRQYPVSPWLPLVRVQGGLVRLSRAELLRQEAEVAAGGLERLEESRQQLRAAITELRTAKETIAEELRSRPPTRKIEPGQMTTNELLSLDKNVQYQLARAYRNQGQTYPPGSDDQINSLTQAAEMLKPLTLLDGVNPLAWQSRLEEIDCYRLLKDEAGAEQRLAVLESQEPPPQIALGARAQRVRLALARGQIAQALAEFKSGRSLEGQTSAELDLAWLETCLAAWRKASEAMQTVEAQQWQNQGVDLVRDMDQRYGPYWSRRAETLLAANIAGSKTTDDLRVLRLAAESFYRGGQFDEALTAYDRLREQALAKNLLQEAFDAGFTAAAIEQERQRFSQAAVRFRQTALSRKELSKAAESHQLAIFNAGQALKASEANNSPEAPTAAAEYQELLIEHLATWPQSASANQVRLWLGRIYERQGNHADALTILRQIPPDAPQFFETVETLARCYHEALTQRQVEGQPTQELAQAAAKYFEDLVVGAQNRLPEKWSPLDRLAAVSSAGLLLEYTTGSFDRAERILSAALTGSSDAPLEWRATAEGLLTFALAGQGRRDEAGKILERISTGPPGELLALVAGLSRLSQSASPEVKRELGILELRAAQLLAGRTKDLTEAQRRGFDLQVAQALAAAGRKDEARRALETLASQSPRDGAIQEEYAQILLASGDAASLKLAESRWRDLLQKSRPGTDRYFRAAFGLASTLEKTGDKRRALQLVSITQAQYPDLGGATLKTRFQQLQQRCKP
jgi:hypothetical protein